jgi:hypothetical protein
MVGSIANYLNPSSLTLKVLKENTLRSVMYILMVLVLLSGCSYNKELVHESTETWDEWIATCKSYKDVDNWMKSNWSYDRARLYEASSVKKSREDWQVIYSPEITFKLKRGICNDAAVFIKHSLNRINPNYKAEIIHLFPGSFPDHYVCGFFVDNKLFVMDRGTAYWNMSGLYGPYSSLDEYAGVYISHHPVHHSLKWARFGWPAWRSSEKW